MTKKDETGATEATTKMMIRSDADKRVAIEAIKACNLSTMMTLTPPRASDELTGRMHCAIRCVAKQLPWDGEYLSEEDWKRFLVASLYGQRVLRAANGDHLVVLDRHTSRLSGPQKFDFTEFVYAFGSEHGVVFDDTQEN